MTGRSEVASGREGGEPARGWRSLAPAVIPPDSPRARQFFYCALVLGLAYAAINPPFAVNDERSHLLRAYEIARGRLITKARGDGPYHVVPSEYRDAIRRYANLQKEPEARIDPHAILDDLFTPQGFDKTGEFGSGAGEYAPVPYLPELPALWLAIQLRLPTLWHIYLARFAGVVCFALLGSWSVAFADRLGWLFFAVGIAPMTLTQAAGLSADGATNGLSLLFFALLGRGALLEKDGLSRQHQRVLLWLLALLVACRPATLCFVLALPALRLEGDSATRRWRYSGQALAVGALTILIWAGLNRAVIRTRVGPPVLEQLAWIWTHPRAVARVWATSSFTQLDDYAIQFVAFRDILSRQMRFSGGTAVALYGELLVLLAFGAAWRSEAERGGQRRVAGYLALAVLTFTFSTWFAVYLIYNPRGADHVHGMQGRFLLPVAPALLLALAALGRPLAARWLNAAPAIRIVTPIVALNVWCLLALIGRYYFPVSVDWPY